MGALKQRNDTGFTFLKRWENLVEGERRGSLERVESGRAEVDCWQEWNLGDQEEATSNLVLFSCYMFFIAFNHT